jgi:hypothetical protein
VIRAQRDRRATGRAVVPPAGTPLPDYVIVFSDNTFEADRSAY